MWHSMHMKKLNNWTVLDFKRLAIFRLSKSELIDRVRNGMIDDIIEVSHKFEGSCHSAHSAVLRCPKNISTIVIRLSVD